MHYRKMKANAAVLIVSGSAIAAILVLTSFYKREGRKKQTEDPASATNKANTLPSHGYHDAEEGLNVDTGGGAKDDGTAFLAGAGLAAVITTATVTSLSSEDGNGFSNSYGGDNATSSGVDGDGGGAGAGAV